MSCNSEAEADRLARQCCAIVWQIRKKSQYAKLLPIAMRGLLVVRAYKATRAKQLQRP